MTGSWCLIHECDFLACPCPERRSVDRAPQLVVVCALCNRHVSRHDDAKCTEPEYEQRACA